MTGWFLLIASCVASGALGFSAVRFRSATLREPVAPARVPRAPSRPAPRRRATVSGPTAPQPDQRLLALWASQVEAGTRKMSVATDGCRVTWNRVCKHGHPTWLVYLHYVSPD